MDRRENRETTIRADALRYRYVGQDADAVADVSVAFETGRFHVLVGANGSGKTTLLKLLAGILKPTSGEVLVGADAMPLLNLAPKARARRVALLLQEGGRPSDLLLREFVLCGRYPYIPFWSQPAAEDVAAADAAIARCGLAAFASRPMRALSSGQRQLARVAQVVAQDAEVVLLDEPTTFLDLSVQQRIFRILADLRREKGVTVVASLHDLHTAERVADVVHAMKDGCLVASGSPREVLTPACVKEVFDVDEW